MEARLIPMHVNRVKAERTRATNVQPPIQFLLHNPESAANVLDDLAGHLFGLTVTNDGPSPRSHANKPRNSRADFQATAPSRQGRLLLALNPITVNDIPDSLSRLAIHETTPEIGNTSSSTESQANPLTNSSNTNIRPPHPLSAPASIIGGCRLGLSKRDRNQRSARALKWLANIKSRIQRCYWLLLDASEEHLSSLSSEVVAFRQATTNIKFEMDSVSSREKDVLDALDNLQGETPKGSIEFVSVDRMDATAQVASIIGSICSTVTGVSKRGGNLIMGALTLLLYLAFQTIDGSLSLSHENVLRQDPSTIEDTVAKLNLSCNTIPLTVCTCHGLFTRKAHLF
ncbi:hypothetical protein F5I97DRAFT_1304560 [Phlebopus sp. FC_14]|nr:hypothetical protein F5I97DRAFT_1304560 [Phlebopus sp. FC_14]